MVAACLGDTLQGGKGETQKVTWIGAGAYGGAGEEGREDPMPV